MFCLFYFVMVCVLFECYLCVKDLNQVVLIVDCFVVYVELSFLFVSDDIDFLLCVIGVMVIVYMLVEVFGEWFEQCWIYYVCVQLFVDGYGVSCMLWFVVM